MASAMRRIDQLIASLGYGTRREAREWLRESRVTVRGVPATDPGARVEPADVRIDGEPLDHPGRLLILLNKPAGRVCSHDPSEGPSVYGLLPARWQRRNPAVTSVGRLDKETTGLLLLTDCSAIVHRLTSPRHKVPKVYRAILDCGLPPGAEAVFASGRCLLAGDDKPCEPATLRRIGEREVEIAVTEGRYHQVRRMFASLGCAVLSLHRTRFGDLDMGNLAPGQWIEFPVNHFDPA
jgi:16S rRNA pseudouridine516 synthase